MAITLRTVTGSALSYLQVDTNFSSYYYSSSISGSTVTFFKTGSVAIGEPPSSSSITLPLPSKWTDITGGIQRTSLVRVVGPFAQGNSNVSAAGVYSHAQGALTQAIGTGSHAEGYSSTANGIYSHAEGESTQATNIGAHAEGFLTEASGQYSHAEGRSTLASGTGSHAEGLGTIASGDYQHTQGKYNIASSEESAFIVGNGTSDGSRSNLIHAAGTTVQVTGSLNVTSGITGSLFGTASRATSASWAPNASPIEVYNNVSDLGTLYSTAPGAAGGTTNVTASIMFGWNAGGNSNNINGVTFLGNRAGRNTVNIDGSNFIGSETGLETSASRSNFIGQYTGRYATNASNSNFLGYAAGNSANAANNSNFLGYQAGGSATSASNSNFLGTSAGQSAVSASYSTLIGHQVGYNTGTSIGSNNIIIGTNITLAAQQTNAINLGGIIFATGSYATTTGNPFSGSMPSSRVGIATTTPQHTLDVNGNGNFTSNLTVTGSVSISDILTLTRRTTTPTPQEGMIISSGSAGASILYYYNGTIWNPLF